MEPRPIDPRELLLLPGEEKYVDVVNVSDFGANQLRLVVEEMSPKRAGVWIASGPVSNIAPIIHQTHEMVFEVSSGNGPDEAWEGNLFRKYSESQYLKYVRGAYENINVLEETHQHWAIIGLNRHVHVISVVEPTVKVWQSN
jgi:hypothetical protein